MDPKAMRIAQQVDLPEKLFEASKHIRHICEQQQQKHNKALLKGIIDQSP